MASLVEEMVEKAKHGLHIPSDLFQMHQCVCNLSSKHFVGAAEARRLCREHPEWDHHVPNFLLWQRCATQASQGPAAAEKSVMTMTQRVRHGD